MEATVKNIESLKNEIPYTLFNRSGVKFNEAFLDEIVLEHGHKTIINDITFIAYEYDKKGNFCFGVEMRQGSNSRSNTSQIRHKERVIYTRTNQLDSFTHKGYQGEFSQEAFEILEGYIGNYKSDDEQFPYGELSWFDIMLDENRDEYAVFGEDSKYTDSEAVLVKL